MITIKTALDIFGVYQQGGSPALLAAKVAAILDGKSPDSVGPMLIKDIREMIQRTESLVPKLTLVDDVPPIDYIQHDGKTWYLRTDIETMTAGQFFDIDALLAGRPVNEGLEGILPAILHPSDHAPYSEAWLDNREELLQLPYSPCFDVLIGFFRSWVEQRATFLASGVAEEAEAKAETQSE